MKEKTIFIAIEGSDGSGKETQTILLENRLLEEGYKVKRISFPSYHSFPESLPLLSLQIF